MVRKNNKKTSRESVSSEESSQDKLDEILQRVSCLDNIQTKLANVEAILAATQAENKVLKETVVAQDRQIVDLKNKLNSLEQHGRSFSIRVNNLPLEAEEEKEPTAVIKKVYSALLLPILQGAASQKAISQVPSCYECIEMAHPLLGRGDKPKPIIVRFFNRNVKALIFKHRKEFAPTTTSDGQRPRYKFPFHDDLTKDTFQKMKQMQDDPRVQSCWSTGGSLRYKLVDSSVIKRVPSVYLSNDEILK
jgi:hypothetical protein